MELRHRPEIAVVELGMNHAGEISTLVGVAEPDVRVWTNVGEAHLGFFASMDAIADAKAEILEGATPRSLLVSNADDQRVAERARRFAGRRDDVRHRSRRRCAGPPRSTIAASTARARTWSRLAERWTSRRRSSAGRIWPTSLRRPRSRLSSTSPLAAIAERARGLRPASHRGEIVRLASGVTVIDDSYNANPTATKRALDVLAHAKSGRRLAVLGEMLELGDRAVPLHEDVGRAAARAGVEVLVAVGGPPAWRWRRRRSPRGCRGPACTTWPPATKRPTSWPRWSIAGDLVLVKGSRGVKTDRVVERLKAGRA